ncbi:hypothetical protein [Bowmanella sp. JS7-9]|uniref:Uncharacterized protein n=1 Tax=Pseudobowmanella zhangzhouensis TaxID=1537679 RepID=A0ABW1XQ48_9ALTE|nr:hypothetical protein [Bowmanella sp. JS7-9]TBX20368.1 hypothetical protein TK45_15365 [Bowmanella sp. JS7-9]
MSDKPFLLSGRNTIIHKQKKYDLIIINGDVEPVLMVNHRGIKEFTGEVPANKRDARMMDSELVDLSSSDIFGEEKILLFIQTINGKEYKIDYSKVGTDAFITVHQESML